MRNMRKKTRMILKIIENPCVFGELWRIGEFQGILQLNKPVQSEQNPLENAGRGRRARPMERSDK